MKGPTCIPIVMLHAHDELLTPAEQQRAAILMAFVEAIDALGGRVLPRHTHDAPLQIDIPPEHQAKADALVRQLEIDLQKTRPS
jgi:hypothetical protein